jgi:hypothetical protein
MLAFFNELHRGHAITCILQFVQIHIHLQDYATTLHSVYPKKMLLSLLSWLICRCQDIHMMLNDFAGDNSMRQSILRACER